MKPLNILCIDAEDTCRLYDSLFSAPGKTITFTCATDLDEAVDLVKAGRFDLIILEPYGQGFDGIELCSLIRKTNVDTPIIIYSGMEREIDRIEGLAAGANAYLVKPSDLDKFIEMAKEFLN